MELCYRKAEMKDIAVLCELRKTQLIDEGAKPDINIDQELYEFFQKHFENGSMVEWVAECDGEIVATAAIVFYEFPPSFTNKTGIKGYVANMYTHPDYRKRGIASKMLDRLVEEARNRNVDKLYLLASKMGRPVYQKYGFTQADEWLEMNDF